MNNEILLLIKKRTDTLIEQARTKSQETLEIKSKKQMETSSFLQVLNLLEEGKWLLAVASFETTNSVFDKTPENKILSFSTTSRWVPDGSEEIVDQ